MTAILVFREDMIRRQRAGAATTTTKLLTLWEEYRAGNRSASSLLSSGSNLISLNVRIIK